MPGAESIQIRLRDRYECFARLWHPPSPRAGVLYLHGIQSHGGWYEQSAERLSRAGLTVLMPDRRGSGRNTIDRGHTPSARQLLRDGADYLDELHVRTGLDRLHVVGVSWGGKLALALYRCLPWRVASLTLVAPGLFPRVDLPFRAKLRVGLTAVAARRTLFDIPLNDPELFTANPGRQDFIRRDPLALRQVTTSFLLASRRLDRYVRGVIRMKQGAPLRLFLAGCDRIIDNAVTKAFVRRLDWPAREITEYDGAHHTLEFEQDPEPFFRDLEEWLTAAASPVHD